MRRALELAAHGMGHTSPNPMVGAVIVSADGRIIGEGYHRRCGEGHAEVNAIASVKERDLLHDSTMYVTLEPCSHYGKTPPCAKLIIETGIPRVVTGAGDPNPKVAGRGIAMLREAGVEVTEGVLAGESLSLNARFITAQTLRRPFVTLKWAMSADGFLDRVRTPEHPCAARFSTPLTSVLTHRMRSMHDAILVGSGTILDDNPRLDARLWPTGEAPVPVIIDRRGRVTEDAMVFSGPKGKNALSIHSHTDISRLLHELFASHGITSVIVEGGETVLRSFIDAGIWDLARVETSSLRLGEDGRHPAPELPECTLLQSEAIDGNIINFYSHTALVQVKNL